ncbi:Phenylalanyl-tRNA synthetase beta chain [Liberibacter crescens BT-1]|uniref:Phenylalanine--tRNA ligase beta subunit n=1 Tax=Liberibacter crescens (strain BT-1) TaxID=1215343 RepID=L0EW43_LIBCB|nr:phenylalanine--tRNA ligase subunit beta [Liberibacter crescens]AGA65055.1 Phenylalanyl-tRNA synthetase beta chain [Liberibacter crescens BT-1]AMC13051.1 phenylalanyl-tRNA synthetase subunit beta [Liberibacter crescens]
MKFTLSWLKNYLDTDAGLEQICDRLTSIGLEVENVDNRKIFSSLIIGQVLSCWKHPDADHLMVLKVDIGQELPVQVVCGALNVRIGMKGVWAPPGSDIPGLGIRIDVSKIRGVESCGMMCSEKELMLSDNHLGIIELSSDSPVGVCFGNYEDGLSDPIIEIALTPNRSDCAGVYGIARDLAASGLGILKERSVPSFLIFDNVMPLDVRFELDEPNFCQGFSMRLVRGVRNGPSPKWMRRRLDAIGVRPVNALVDIANYITFDQGYPVHIFDAAKLKGDLVIRRGRHNEKIKVLCDREYELSSDQVVIASDNGVAAIAGIISSMNSCCDDNTTDVLIESSLWNSLNIAHTGRSLGIMTDSRYRFERGVDPQDMIRALDQATEFIIELCEGKASPVIVKNFLMSKLRKIKFSVSEVMRLTGLSISHEESLAILKNLGFIIEISEEEEVLVSVPSWRLDIEGKADLVEEILRIYGVDKIFGKPLVQSQRVVHNALTLQQSRTRLAKRVLAMRAMMEVVTLSFIPKLDATLFRGESCEVELANPISKEMSHMRPSLLPGLLAAVGRNVDRAFTDVAIFEVSHLYENDLPEGQRCVASGVRRGSAVIGGSGRFWSEKENKNGKFVDVFDAKADALSVIEAFMSVSSIRIETNAPSWYHPGRSGLIKIGEKITLGHFGEFHPKTLEALGLSGNVCGFEIYLDSIPVSRKKNISTKPVLTLSPFQPIKRDFAFVVDKFVSSSSLVSSVMNSDRKLIIDVTVFDVFERENLGKGKKSVALEVTIQPLKKTLSEDDFNLLTQRIIDNVFKTTGALLRT